MLNTYSTYTNDVRKETYYTYSIFACWPVAMEYSCEYTFTPTTDSLGGFCVGACVIDSGGILLGGILLLVSANM